MLRILFKRLKQKLKVFPFFFHVNTVPRGEYVLHNIRYTLLSLPGPFLNENHWLLVIPTIILSSPPAPGSVFAIQKICKSVAQRTVLSSLVWGDGSNSSYLPQCIAQSIDRVPGFLSSRPNLPPPPPLHPRASVAVAPLWF